MKKYEMLKALASVCKVLADNGISPTDYKFVSMVEEYYRMKREGHKYAYIVFYLSQQYDIGETTVYRIIKRLGEDIAI